MLAGVYKYPVDINMMCVASGETMQWQVLDDLCMCCVVQRIIAVWPVPRNSQEHDCGRRAKYGIDAFLLFYAQPCGWK